MDGWWWIPIGLVIWFAVAIAVALWLGPVLRSCSRAREALEQDTARVLDLPGQPLRHRRFAEGSGAKVAAHNPAAADQPGVLTQVPRVVRW
jgi:hypothetical protein